MLNPSTTSIFDIPCSTFYSQRIIKWIMPLVKGMILFYFLTTCSKNQDEITLRWQDDKATGISIPLRYFSEIPEDSIATLATVHLLKPGVQPPILGDFVFHRAAITFQPMVPFTPGLQYEVRLRNRSLTQFSVPLPNRKNAAQVLGIYPSQDTLPYNVLKFYIRFSGTMSEGRALEHIALLNCKDTIRLAFLDLKPELWNQDRTLLTLWLDPGRIKRDLQPNKKLGAPLQVGEHYALTIDSLWKDVRGSALQRSVSKKFVVVQRDSLSPDTRQWTIQPPVSGNNEALIVDLHESLDYALLNEAVSVVDEKGNQVPGRIYVEEEESRVRFIPDSPWTAGTYTFQCEARLEDLAGNNLNRPFDRDLTQSAANSTQEIFSRKFVVN